MEKEERLDIINLNITNTSDISEFISHVKLKCMYSANRSYNGSDCLALTLCTCGSCPLWHTGKAALVFLKNRKRNLSLKNSNKVYKSSQKFNLYGKVL